MRGKYAYREIRFFVEICGAACRPLRTITLMSSFFLRGRGYAAQIDGLAAVSVNTTEGAASYQEADEAYRAAMRLSEKVQRIEKLNEALEGMSSFLEAHPTAVSGQILASEIYRAKGGASYAVKYNRQAKTLLSACVAATNGQDPSSVLDYAILCYAGDDRFTADAEKSSELGRKQARIVLEETETMLKTSQSSAMKEGLLEIAAMACLILGDREQCSQHLEEAHSSWKELFQNTVAKETWLWPVSKAENVEKEFLLQYLKNS